MFKTVSSLFVVSLAVAVLGVSDAHATTFCVPNFHAACPNNGTNVAQADLQTAMTTNATDGVADVVEVAAGTFTDTASVDPSGSDPLTVEGAGATTEVTTSSNANLYIFNLAANGNARAITMRNLKIVIPAVVVDNGGAAAQISGDTLENVDIESRNPGSSGLVSWIGGGTFRGGRIFSTGAGSIFNDVRTDGNATGTVNIEDATLDHPIGSGVTATGPGTVNVRRSRVVGAAQLPIAASAGTTNVQNTVIEAANNTEAISATANSASNVAINADHVTAVAAGGNAAAFGSQVLVAQSGNASLTVTNSIERGFASAYIRQAPVGAATGNADLTIGYSNFHVAGGEPNTGDGTLSVANGKIDADPQFVSATDFQLKPGSPSIDAGDPGAGGLTEDYLKALRPIDGDANGSAVRDQGAYEYQPPAPQNPPADPSDPADPADPAGPSDPSDPTDPGSPGNGGPDTSAPDTVKGKGPKAKLRKKSATFEFSSEAGATFECALDGKALASCSSPMTVKHLKRGKHVFTAAAVDAAGNVDQTPASWAFKTVKKRKRR